MNKSPKRVAVIGAGFSGLSAAAYAAKAGNEVHVFEKHNQPGGRARQFATPEGYHFDMGPSWYWMPDVIENFFNDFGSSTSDHFELVSLDPQFDIIFDDGMLSVPRSYEELRALFEAMEPGAGARLDSFMQSAKVKYDIAMGEFVVKPCHSWWEFASPQLAKNAMKLDLLVNFKEYVSRYFSNPKLTALMEFPVIFLGASPKNIPSMYSLMNYGGYVMGTKYPMGGYYQLVLAMQRIAEQQGVTFHFEHNVESIKCIGGYVTSISANGKQHTCDALIAASDYHFTETLLPVHLRNYNEDYWQKRTFAPSALIYYIGLRERIPNLKHHTLFFEHDLEEHLDCVFKNKDWPENPLFYCCCPSKTDPSIAPSGSENIFLLLPLATGLQDDETRRETYLREMLGRIERHTGASNLEEKIDFKRSYCVNDFKADYNAFGGNAYGLANTLRQTAVLKPKIRNKKIPNLFYSGQLTVPGPGVPPAIISGKISAQEVMKLNVNHESSF